LTCDATIVSEAKGKVTVLGRRTKALLVGALDSARPGS
jgi:hypothetical protein